MKCINFYKISFLIFFSGIILASDDRSFEQKIALNIFMHSLLAHAAISNNNEFVSVAHISQNTQNSFGFILDYHIYKSVKGFLGQNKSLLHSAGLTNCLVTYSPSNRLVVGFSGENIRLNFQPHAQVMQSSVSQGAAYSSSMIDIN